MKRALAETKRRREVQSKYNADHGITPRTIVKPIEATLVTASEADYFREAFDVSSIEEYSLERIGETIAQLEREMRSAAQALEFERAAEIRDKVKALRERQIALG